MAEHPARVERPLSPHLQIYRLTFTFLMSGFHRVTGIVTYLGFLLVVWWLVAAAAGPNDYAWVQWFFSTWLGRLVLLGFSWGLIHNPLAIFLLIYLYFLLAMMVVNPNNLRKRGN